MPLLIETVSVAALLLAWSGVAVAAPPEGRTLATILLALLTAGVWEMLASGLRADRTRRGAADAWWGADAAIRRLATPLALGGCLALVVWGGVRASAGARLGGYGALMVLLVVASVAAKFVAETYLFSQLGGPATPRQESAQRLIGPLSGWSKLRYALGALGGIVLPLGAQLLAGGAKNIPAVVDAGPPAAMAVAALAFLIPSELLERWLFWRAG